MKIPTWIKALAIGAGAYLLGVYLVNNVDAVGKAVSKKPKAPSA